MKTFGRIAVLVMALVLVAGAVVYVDGASLPVNHSATVSGLVEAPPAKVFGMITNVAIGAAWRPAVKKVTMLPPDQGRDHWVEDLGQGTTMTFLAVRTDPGVKREVLLDDPHASYGGTWVYEVSPGPRAGTTLLKITETGFIHPPVYRFMMAHLFGMTRNLDQYLTDIQAAVH